MENFNQMRSRNMNSLYYLIGSGFKCAAYSCRYCCTVPHIEITHMHFECVEMWKLICWNWHQWDRVLFAAFSSNSPCHTIYRCREYWLPNCYDCHLVRRYWYPSARIQRREQIPIRVRAIHARWSSSQMVEIKIGISIKKSNTCLLNNNPNAVMSGRMAPPSVCAHAPIEHMCTCVIYFYFIFHSQFSNYISLQRDLNEWNEWYRILDTDLLILVFTYNKTGPRARH